VNDSVERFLHYWCQKSQPWRLSITAHLHLQSRSVTISAGGPSIQRIEGLTPGKSYEYRLVATTSSGTTTTDWTKATQGELSFDKGGS